MPAKLDRKNLKLRHAVYWLKLSIPRSVRHLFLTANGKERAHIEENLRTKDPDEANRRKHSRIHYWLAEFDRRAKMAAGTLAPDIAEAFRLRDALRNADTSEERGHIREQAEERARKITGEPGRQSWRGNIANWSGGSKFNRRWSKFDNFVVEKARKLNPDLVILDRRKLRIVRECWGNLAAPKKIEGDSV